MKTIELIEYGEPVTTTDADGNETTTRPVTVLQSEDVDETPQPTRFDADGEPTEWRDPWQNAWRRFKGTAGLMNRGLKEKKYDAREKPAEEAP